MTGPTDDRPKARAVSVQFDPPLASAQTDETPSASRHIVQPQEPDDYDISFSWPISLLAFLGIVGIFFALALLSTYQKGFYEASTRRQIRLYCFIYLGAVACATPFLIIAGRRISQRENADAPPNLPRSTLGQKVPFYTSKNPYVPLIPIAIGTLLLLGVVTGALPFYSIAGPIVFISMGIRLAVKQRNNK
jgi:hypothetical protein